MPSYIYKARDAIGKAVKGTMDAETKAELIDKLHKIGYMTTQVTEVAPGIKVGSVVDKLKRISVDDMLMFYFQLSNMINAGITIVTSLDIVGKQIENKRLKETIGDVLRNIETGESFSQALAKHPRLFPLLFISMVKVGEASGKLDMILIRFAEFIDHQTELRQKIRGAFFYPLILLFASMAVTLFVVTFIIPQFAELFMRAGIRLPMPTLIFYKIGTWIKHFWYLTVLLGTGGWLGVRRYVNTEKGRLELDRFKLKLPVVGLLYRKTATSRFARALSTLVASGVPILESLDIVKEVVGNKVLGQVIENVRNFVEKGEKISEPLKISGEFPPDVVQMVSVGEETGDLDGMLNKISDFYDRSVAYSIKKLTIIIEPLFLIIMGCIVGFIMASMLLPIFDMIKILRR